MFHPPFFIFLMSGRGVFMHSGGWMGLKPAVGGGQAGAKQLKYRPVWGLGSLVKVMIPNFDIFHANPLISRQPGLYSVFTCIYKTQNAQPLRKQISGPYLELLHEPDPKDPAKSDVRPMCWLESRIGFGCMRY
jgi:hypothetical protein